MKVRAVHAHSQPAAALLPWPGRSASAPPRAACKPAPVSSLTSFLFLPPMHVHPDTAQVKYVVKDPAYWVPEYCPPYEPDYEVGKEEGAVPLHAAQLGGALVVTGQLPRCRPRPACRPRQLLTPSPALPRFLKLRSSGPMATTWAWATCRRRPRCAATMRGRWQRRLPACLPAPCLPAPCVPCDAPRPARLIAFFLRAATTALPAKQVGESVRFKWDKGETHSIWRYPGGECPMVGGRAGGTHTPCTATDLQASRRPVVLLASSCVCALLRVRPP